MKKSIVSIILVSVLVIVGIAMSFKPELKEIFNRTDSVKQVSPRDIKEKQNSNGTLNGSQQNEVKASQAGTPDDSAKKDEKPQSLEASGSQTVAEVIQVDYSKPNPPITQETIDCLAREQANKGRGKKHILKVTQQIQRAWNTCAPTTVSMMLSIRGVTVSQEVLAKEMGTDTTFGTHNANAIRVLNRYLFGYDTPQANQSGYRLATVTTSDPNSEQMNLFKERLKQNISDGYPMYYTFDCAKIYPGSAGEHNVIGIGYQLTEDGSDVAYLYYVDPSYNQQDSVYGGLKKITPEELFEGMLTCVEANYAW